MRTLLQAAIVAVLALAGVGLVFGLSGPPDALTLTPIQHTAHRTACV